MKSVEEILGVSKSYLINLDRRKDRLENFERNVKEKGLIFSNFERFPAIDAKTLSDQYINSIIDPSARKSVFGKREYHEELNGKGSVGCYLSHITLWDIALSTNQTILIMEDDINFVDGIMEKLQEISSFLPQSSSGELILFNYQFNTKPEKINEYIFKVKHFFGLGFYIITPEFVKKMQQFLFPLKYQIDSVLSFLSPFVNIYAVSDKNGNPLVYQNSAFTSDAQSVVKVENFKYLDNSRCNTYKYILYLVILIIILSLIYRYRYILKKLIK